MVHQGSSLYEYLCKEKSTFGNDLSLNTLPSCDNSLFIFIRLCLSTVTIHENVSWGKTGFVSKADKSISMIISDSGPSFVVV